MKKSFMELKTRSKSPQIIVYKQPKCTKKSLITMKEEKQLINVFMFSVGVVAPLDFFPQKDLNSWQHTANSTSQKLRKSCVLHCKIFKKLRTCKV